MVCAWCNVVQSRDRNGRGERLDMSDVSHTICPACARTHFSVTISEQQHVVNTAFQGNTVLEGHLHSAWASR
jgi:hypothetical protein